VAKTRGSHLFVGEQALPGQAGDLVVHPLTGLDLDAKTVDGAALPRVFDSTSFSGGSATANVA
jgi:hypothetical protein